MPLTIILPTRGRPAVLCETLSRTLPNITRDDTRLVVAIDDDDETMKGHEEFLPKDDRLIVDSREREDSIGAKWSRGYYFYPADQYMIMADYNRPLTPGFDQKMLDAGSLFPDGIGVVFGYNANPTFAGTYGVTHKLCEHLGWMFPPYFPFWFVDHWLDDIARLIGRISYADVHVASPEVKLPTQEFREVSFWATFFDSQRLVRRRQARAIIDSPEFQDPEWRKEILRRHYPLVEYRSQLTNDVVRSWNAADLAGPGGERYERLKKAAMEMMIAEWPEMQAELGIAA